jgi:UDP-N-acetylglucosamine 2-epimerase (non-hydrolysing)
LAQSGGLWNNLLGVRLVEPLGYIEFLGLLAKARVVITDSGGVQEETTALRVPCVTVRHNTERPITITEGTNRLVPPMHEQIVIASREPLKNIGSVPELWDGKAGKRIVDNIERWLVEV